MQPLVNINLENYNIEETLTEFKKGGALLHISSNINYKVHKDLKTYKRKETRIISRNMNKFIIESIYKHDKMSIKEFNKHSDANFRNNFHGKQGGISDGRFQNQSHKL